MAKKIKYAEPAEYIPKNLRKEFGLGEYANDAPKKDEKKTSAKKTDTKKADTKKK